MAYPHRMDYGGGTGGRDLRVFNNRYGAPSTGCSGANGQPIRLRTTYALEFKLMEGDPQPDER